MFNEDNTIEQMTLASLRKMDGSMSRRKICRDGMMMYLWSLW